MMTTERPLVLASASVSRRAVLTNAGLEFDAQPADVDEQAIKIGLGADLAGDDLAAVLAQVKAETVSALRPDAVVIGADQTLASGARLFDKPRDMTEARDHLLVLRGQTHTLASAVSVAVSGDVVWSHTALAHLTMRHLTADEVGAYLGRAGDAILSSVGAYHLEGLGAHLFERIDGDFFTILGLPLLPLLNQLRQAHGLKL